MKKSTGFTLIELMIVVAIIGVLAAIAYPSYQSAMMEARRGVAQGDLLELAGDMERYYTTNASYSGATLTFIESPQEGATKYYDLSSAIPSVTTFTLSAIPRAGTPQASDPCGTLTFTHAGEKNAAIAGCW